MFNSDILSHLFDEIIPVLDKYAVSHQDFEIEGIPYKDMKMEMKDLMLGINMGAERIKTLVANLKQFIRADAGALNQQVNINSVIKSSIIILGNLIKKATDRFEEDLDSSIPLISGNEQQIEQVIINLLSNACQALTKKKQRIMIKTGWKSESETVSITVTDEGKGIPHENLKKVMDPFFTTRRDEGGTGLGLSVTFSIIEAHHGNLRFESEAGLGTTVIVTLPMLKK